MMNFYGGRRAGKSETVLRHTALMLLRGEPVLFATTDPVSTVRTLSEYFDQFGKGAHDQLFCGLRLINPGDTQ